MKEKILGYIVLYFTSMIPWVEQKAGTIAIASGMTILEAFIVQILSMITIVPIIILFAEKILKLLKSINKLKPYFDKYEDKIIKSKEKFENYEVIGLFLVVLFPSTGMWTASFLSSILKLDKIKSMISIILGAMCVSIIYLIGTEVVINVLVGLVDYLKRIIN